MSSYSHFFSKKFQHICISLDVNFNESLTNDVVTFEQLGPDFFKVSKYQTSKFHGEFMSPALFLFEVLKKVKLTRGPLVLYQLPKY